MLVMQASCNWFLQLCFLVERMARTVRLGGGKTVCSVRSKRADKVFVVRNYDKLHN